MTIRNKVFHLDSQFTKELPTADEKIDNIYISGYASATSIDRSGDVVPSSVWEKGIQNYLKNPVLLAYHDHDDPVGRTVEHRIDSGGLWIKARVSAASEVFNLVKDGVLTAFSIGFRVLDAEYNSATELFVIKELELLEISVVAVPCNQDTLFSLSKAFESEEDYKSFKSQFAPTSESAKGLESSTEAKSTTLKEIGMDPKELQEMLANAAKSAADAVLAGQAREKALADQTAAEEAAMQERINKAVAAVTPTSTGAEKLLADIEKRFADQSEAQKSTLDGLQAALKEKADELAALQKSKMTFSDANGTKGIEYAEKETAFMLGKIMGKSIEDTKYGKNLVTKYAGSTPGNHLPGATWELEVSLNMEAEVRRRLVVAPILRSINMQTNVMKIPLNPEAGYATWMANSSFNAAASAGATATHALTDITLSAFKVATNEYVGYEEEEDSLLVILPIVRDAMIRRTAKSVDKAFLLGAGAGADPVKGLTKYDDVSVVTVSSAGGAGAYQNVIISLLRSLRKDLGAGGLDPSDVVYLVNTETYFALLDDASFQTMDKVGPNATILTGQVGQVAGSPVLVSAEIPANAISTNAAGNTANVMALAVSKSNWLVGNQRGLRFDVQDLAETQRKVLVASLRTGMTQLTTNLGQGVSVMRMIT